MLLETLPDIVLASSDQLQDITIFISRLDLKRLNDPLAWIHGALSSLPSHNSLRSLHFNLTITRSSLAGFTTISQSWLALQSLLEERFAALKSVYFEMILEDGVEYEDVEFRSTNFLLRRSKRRLQFYFMSVRMDNELWICYRGVA